MSEGKRGKLQHLDAIVLSKAENGFLLFEGKSSKLADMSILKFPERHVASDKTLPDLLSNCIERLLPYHGSVDLFELPGKSFVTIQKIHGGFQVCVCHRQGITSFGAPSCIDKSRCTPIVCEFAAKAVVAAIEASGCAV